MSQPTPQEAIARLFSILPWWKAQYAKRYGVRGKNTPYGLLTYYGHVVATDRAAFDEQVRSAAVPGPVTLNTYELLRWDTWFYLHPEKVAGREEVITSQQFPLTIVGTRADVERTIRACIDHLPLPSASSTSALDMKLKIAKARAKALLLLGMAESTADLSGLGSLLQAPGLSGLGELSTETRSRIADNTLAVEAVLAAARSDRQLGPTDALDFETVVKLYNPGVTAEEMRAWVWYQREIGNPMKGWNAYYLKGHIFGARRRELQTVLGEGRPEEKQLTALVKAGAMYYHDGHLHPYPVYAFGNMYDRELMLGQDEATIRSLYGQEVVDRHWQVLKTCRPRPLSVQTAAATERPRILATSDFARNFTITGLREEAGVVWPGAEGDTLGTDPLNLSSALELWLRTRPAHEFGETTASQQIAYYLHNASMRGLDDGQKQTITMFAGPECEAFFARFLHEALLFDDQQKLDFLWNRTFNGQSSVPYLRVPVGFACSAMFKSGPLRFTPAQREAVAFMECAGSGILAYDVGVGKTMSAIITAANALQSGRIQRPLIVVPNPTYAKWIGEIVGFTNAKGQFVPGVLSNTGVKVNEWFNLNTDLRAKLERGKKPYHVEAGTITVVTYEGFEKIGFGKGVGAELVSEMSKVLYQAPAADKKPASARDQEKDRQTIMELIGVGRAGTVVDIDAIGFDSLVIDEAHNFKKVFASVPLDEEGDKRFDLQAGEPSKRGLRLFLLANYVQRTFGTRALVLLLTATPFTNSPLEIYSMLSLVGLDQLERMGLTNLVKFMQTFVQVTAEWVNSYDGTVKFQQVVKGYNNRLVLQKLIFNKIAYKTGEDAGVRRPCKVNLPRINVTGPDGRALRLPASEQVPTYLPMTARQKRNQLDITARLQAGGGSPEARADLMRALSDSLNNALSPHLYEKEQPESPEEFVEQSPKLHYICQCVATVKAWHEQRGEAVSGQVIYLNRGKDWFGLIKQYLEQQVGYQPTVTHQGKRFGEVEIIVSGIANDRKEAIKDAFLAGVVKVIIGTQTIREGIDLQTFGTVIYNGYPDWNPTDVKQLEGRIWRQGNTFGYVRSVLPLVENSMDVFVAQKLEEKQARVNDIFYRADTGNMLSIEDIDPEEIKFAIFTDESQLFRMVADRDIKDARRRLAVAQGEMEGIRGLDKQRALYQTTLAAAWQRLRERHALLSKHLDPSRYKTWDSLRYAWGGTGDVDPPQGYYATHYGAAWSAERRTNFHERVRDVLERLAPVLEAGAVDDRELLDVGRAVEKVAESILGQTDTTFSDFKEAFVGLSKTIKTVLGPRGLGPDANMVPVLEELTAQSERIQRELAEYQGQYFTVLATDSEEEKTRKLAANAASDAYRQRVEQEIRDRKARLQITPGTVGLRVEQFASLNYLLTYKDADKPESCELPGQPCCLPTRSHRNGEAQAPAPSPALRLKIKIAQARAKALLLLALDH